MNLKWNQLAAVGLITAASCLTFTQSTAEVAISKIVHFPHGFKWCVSTSAHQIEGGNTSSDWWLWEHGRGHIAHGDVSGAADDHWNRLAEDQQLLKNLNVSDYRMSIEWAKIEPQQGKFDGQAIAHYRNEIAGLRALGIRPIITLQHFTFPEWVRAKGAWQWEGFTQAFENFAAIAYKDIAPGVRDWITINEPTVTVINGYLTGTAPPGEKRKVKNIVPILSGLLKAHAAVYHLLHKYAADAHVDIRVGMAHHLRSMDPANPFSPLDIIATSQADDIWNWALPDALETGHLRIHLLATVDHDEIIRGLAHTQDFVGVNYYTGDLVRISFSQGLKTETRPGLKKTDMGWDIYPEGLYRILMDVTERYKGVSILITENGLADHTDHERPEFIQDHLEAVSRAIARGAPVEGYCHWSLMDNFEWTDGFTPRFGLYAVDYSTFERKPRPSAILFSEIARTNSISLKDH